MSAQLEFYWAMTFTKDGVTMDAGSLDVPVKVVTIDADGVQKHALDIPIASGGTATIYDYNDDGEWDVLVAQILGGEGFVYWRASLDSPADPGVDNSPSGDHSETTQYLGLSCDAALVFSSRECKVNNGATSGLIYGVTFKNFGDDTVTVRVWEH